MKTKIRWQLAYLLPVVFVGATFLLNALSPMVSADTPVSSVINDQTGIWQDHDTITVGTTTFFDPKSDTSLDFTSQDPNISCSDAKLTKLFKKGIIVPDGITVNSKDLSHGTLTSAISATNNDCAETTISLTGAAQENNYFVWDSSTTIKSTDGLRVYTQQGDQFVEQTDKYSTGNGCQDSFTFASTDPSVIATATTATLTMRTDGKKLGILDINTAGYPSSVTGPIIAASKNAQLVSGCYEASATVQIVAQGDTNPHGAIGADSADGSTSPSCESSGFSLEFIMCPIINGLIDAIDGIYGDVIHPLLVTKPVSLDNSCPSTAKDPCYLYNIWSNFRIYGDIFLVIGLLVVVFGQSIGGGMIDAYTVKKVLPRILIAAVLINLSIYIVALAVDLTNVIGGGIQTLLSYPFSNADAFHLTLNGGASATLGLGTLVTGGAGVLGIWALVSGGAAFAVPLIMFLLLFVLMPAFLIMLTILGTVIVRQGLIILLVVTSPVAFALYCLPNTEQYFKKWWDLLYRTLLVYPIIAVIFSISNILSVTISDASKAEGGFLATIAQLIAIIALLVPLFLIPFAFKLAGGVLSRIHEVATQMHKRGQETVKGNANDPRSLRNRTRYNMRSAANDRRSVGVGKLAAKTLVDGGAKTALGRSTYGMAAKLANYGNLQAERAHLYKEQEELVSAQYSMGDDSNIRAMWALQYKGSDDAATGRKNGGWYSPYVGGDGKFKEWNAVDVQKAHDIVRRDPSKLQAYAKYELSKAADDGQAAAFQQRFVDLSNDFGWDSGQANSVWAGVKFAHQNARKELKYTALKGDKGALSFGETDHFGLSRELADGVTKGAFAGFRESTARSSLEGYQAAHSRLTTPGFYTSNDNLKAVKNKDGTDKLDATGNVIRKPAYNMDQDKATRTNYENLASHLETSLFGFSQGGNVQSEGQRQAMAQAAAASAAPGETPEAQGFGLGAGANPEAAWKDFVGAVKNNRQTPTANASGGTPVSPPGAPVGPSRLPTNSSAGSSFGTAPQQPPQIITPDDPDFNVPPDSRRGRL